MGKPASFASNESFCVPLELRKRHVSVSHFASMQVLRRRQVLPEEQHDPVPDRLRGRTDEGRLRAAGPLTTLRPRRSQEGTELREDLKGTCNQTQEALVSSPAPVPITLYIRRAHIRDGVLYRLAIEMFLVSGRTFEDGPRLWFGFNDSA